MTGRTLYEKDVSKAPRQNTLELEQIYYRDRGKYIALLASFY